MGFLFFPPHVLSVKWRMHAAECIMPAVNHCAVVYARVTFRDQRALSFSVPSWTYYSTERWHLFEHSQFDNYHCKQSTVEPWRGKENIVKAFKNWWKLLTECEVASILQRYLLRFAYKPVSPNPSCLLIRLFTLGGHGQTLKHTASPQSNYTEGVLQWCSQVPERTFGETQRPQLWSNGNWTQELTCLLTACWKCTSIPPATAQLSLSMLPTVRIWLPAAWFFSLKWTFVSLLKPQTQVLGPW